MKIYSITLGNQPYNLSTADDAQIAAIGQKRVAYNATLPADSPDQLADDAAYVQFIMSGWAASNPHFLPQDVTDIFAVACADYAKQKPPTTLPPQLTPESRNAGLKAYAAAKRYAIETGGITFQGMQIATDRGTQDKLDQAVLAFQVGVFKNPIDWKGPAGWLKLDAATMLAIATAVATLVQQAFSAEGAVCAAIDAGVITKVDQIEAAAWPSN